MRAARSLRAHGAAFAVLAATVAVLVGGVVTAVTVLAGGGGPVATVLPLLALGLVVVPPPVVELSRRRRDELALARVRGAHGASLVVAAAGLAASAAVLGGVAGTLLAALGPGLVGVDDARVDGGGLAWAVAVTGGAVVLVAGCAVLAVREPLARSLRCGPWRPLRDVAAGPVGPAGGVVVTVAALVVVYQALATDTAGGALVLAGSGVLAVAVGQLAAAALRRASPVAETAGARRSTGTTLGLRRALSHDRSPLVRGVVAAAVVAVASLSGAAAAHGWADDATRLDHGAPLRAELPDAGALDTLLLTRRLDPDGRWLMAAAVAVTGPAAEERVAWLDLERYETVAGGYLADTGADLAPLVDRLRDAPVVRTLTGDRLEVAVRDAPRGATVTLDYVDDDGFVATVAVEVVDGVGEAPLPGCARACVALALTASGALEITGLRVGGADLLESAWVGDAEPADAATPGSGGPIALDGGTRVVPADGVVAAPVVTAGAVDLGDDGAAAPPRVTGLGGDPRAVAPLATRAALPLVEGAGVVGDLGVGLAAARGSTTDVTALVLARDDTPAEVLAGLADAGGAARPAGADDDVLGAPDTSQARALRVVGATAALLGLLVLLAGAGRRTREARRETATLRLLGVPRRERWRAVLVEAVVLGLATVVVVAPAGWLCVAVVVDVVGLVPIGPARLPFGTAVAPVTLLAGAVAAGVLLGLAVTLVGLRARGRASAPARLVEDGGR